MNDQPRLQLEIDCPECHGTGFYTPDGEHQLWRCTRCEGGTVPSPLGEEVLAFVGKYFKKLIRDAIGG